MAAVGIHYTTRAILENLKSCDREGPLLRLEMHKYILELLCEYLEAIQQKEQDARRVHIQHRELILKIRDHILSAPNVHEHTSKKLARRFGISESIMRRAFKAYLGISISAYIRIQALAKGEYLLTTTSRTVDDISDELGYAWRQAFDDAFRKQYHYSPVEWRSVQNP
jgi:AraC-like DNA-binding protein